MFLVIFTNFLLEQIHHKREWEDAISGKLYPSLYQNVTEVKFTFIDGRESSEEKSILNRNILTLACI